MSLFSGRTQEIKTDMVINASGAWSSSLLTEKLKIRSVKTLLSAGTMIVFDRRFTKSVINRLRPPSDGDIIVPFFNQSIVGTTAFIVNRPDNVKPDNGDIGFLRSEGAKMLPVLKTYPMHRYYTGVRALIVQSEPDSSGRASSRDFMLFDHARLDGVNGLLSLGGGKLSTARLMARDVGDHVCSMFGSREKSKTDRIRLCWPKIGGKNLARLSRKTALSEGFIREAISESAGRTYSDMYDPIMDIVISRLLF